MAQIRLEYSKKYGSDTSKYTSEQLRRYSRGQWISSLACGMHLHSDALAEIRDAIRKERKERSEVTRLWITTIGGGIGALTGVIGAMIGLLAYLDKLHH
jgi:hypothetical protein